MDAPRCVADPVNVHGQRTRKQGADDRLVAEVPQDAYLTLWRRPGQPAEIVAAGWSTSSAPVGRSARIAVASRTAAPVAAAEEHGGTIVIR